MRNETEWMNRILGDDVRIIHFCYLIAHLGIYYSVLYLDVCTTIILSTQPKLHHVRLHK